MITAAASAASRQCAVPWRTTPRKLRSVSPLVSALYGSAFSHRCTDTGVRSRSTSRRSVAVSGSGGGGTRSVRGSGGRGDLGKELRGCPVVAGGVLHQPAVGPDDGSPQA